MAKKNLCCSCRSYRRKIVWMIDLRFYCQRCAEEAIRAMDDVLLHRIDRLSMNEEDFDSSHPHRRNMSDQPIAV